MQTFELSGSTALLAASVAGNQRYTSRTVTVLYCWQVPGDPDLPVSLDHCVRPSDAFRYCYTDGPRFVARFVITQPSSTVFGTPGSYSECPRFECRTTHLTSRGVCAPSRDSRPAQTLCLIASVVQLQGHHVTQLQTLWASRIHSKSARTHCDGSAF